MDDTDQRFGGIARLYGEPGFARIRAARVAVVGIGGVGSWAVEALARSGVGALTLIDLDEICLSNVNRQLHAMDGQIGRQKTAAMAERVQAIHPACKVAVIPAFFNEKSAAGILDAGHDAVLDAIDSTRHKALLLAECRQRGLITVTCGGAGGRRDPTCIRVADLAHSGRDPLLQQVRRSLRQRHGFPKSPPDGQPEPMGIDAVFSDESRVFLQCDGAVGDARPEEDAGGGRLACDGALGAVTHVTASFGMIAAGRILERIAGAGNATS